MKKILIIGTGGTIASCPGPEGLAPELAASQLAEMIPGIDRLCDLDCVQAFSLDSTNIRPGHWLKLAALIQEKYDRYDGFVITHGTDTMAYTAAGLSYLIQNSGKPIVLTGAQRPIVDENTDARQNLSDAVICACDDGSRGVQIVFGGSVIAGTRARKNYTKSFLAFGSINFPELAYIRDGRLVRYLPEEPAKKTVFSEFLNPNVGLIKLTPGIRNDVLEYAIDRYDGMVIESFGVGGLPEYSDFYEYLRRGADAGKFFVMATQVPNEGSDLSVYRVGNGLVHFPNVLEAHDMTSEAALAKLMWILGQTSDPASVRERFYSPVAHDILFS